MRSSDLLTVEFPMRRFSKGYRPEPVDDLIDRCREALLAVERGLPPTLTAHEIVAAQLPMAGFFSDGYDVDRVDDVLDEVALQLRKAHPGDETAEKYAALHAEVDGYDLSAESAAAMRDLLERARRTDERRSR